MALVSVPTIKDGEEDHGKEHHALAAPVFSAQRLDLAIAPVDPVGSSKKKLAVTAAATTTGVAKHPFQPTCFTAEELKALSGKYRVVISVPGFECVNLRVGNRPIAVTTTSGEVLHGVSRSRSGQNEGSNSSGKDEEIAAGGCIELSPNLWPTSLETAALPSIEQFLQSEDLSTKKSLTALVVEAELEFKPIPVREIRFSPSCDCFVVNLQFYNPEIAEHSSRICAEHIL